MSGTPRRLAIVFETAESFQQEYDSNLSNGGVFIPTRETFELRERVEIVLEFSYAARSLTFAAEIVHIAPEEVVGLGGAAGVAVQFEQAIQELRDAFSEIGAEAADATVDTSDGPRGASRKSARVPVVLRWEGKAFVGKTRNLSVTGALVSVKQSSIPAGEKLQLVLKHPSRDEQLEVFGEVVREIVTSGEVSALGIRFSPDVGDQERLAHFVEELQALEHTKRLGGISGPIQELGPIGLLQMLATTAPKGTLVLRREQEEGVIAFEAGLLRMVRLGAATGMKALVRLLCWRDGVFEFQSHLEEIEMKEAPFPLEAALLDAVRQIDESAMVDPQNFPLHAKLCLIDPKAEGESTVEAALLDLARAGFTVQRALEVVPEPDPEVFRALSALVDAGALALQG